MGKSKSDAAVELWKSGRYDTANIAWVLDMHEADVERVIHADREQRRRAA